MADDKRDTMEGIAKGLVELDTTLREAIAGKGPPGPPGSGLYYLLDHLAVTTLGVPRKSFPRDEPEDKLEDKPEDNSQRDARHPTDTTAGPVDA
jgi:hypothetical protein